MTIAEPTRRPALVAAIRAIAALTVVGSAAAATTLTVRADERVSTVVAAEQPTTAAASTPGRVTVAPAPVPDGSPQAASGPAAGAPAPNAAAPQSAAPGAGGPAPSNTVPLGGAGVPAAAVPLGAGGAPGNSVPIGGGGAPANSVPLGQGGGPANATPLAPGAGPDGSVPIGPASPFAAQSVNTQPACPLGWPAPKEQGGLASLIGLAPLAGPFSSEAFALGSVYQPILQLVGPVLAQIAPVITANQPLIDPIITQVQGVEAVVLEAILPYYGPYRGQLIAAEGDFAKAIAPVLDQVYNSAAASCFVAWQGQIIDQAKGGRITVASLAHPGQVVELGPEK